MPMELDLATVRSFAIALLIGAMVGIEREKRLMSEPGAGIGGLRTFIILAEVGAISAWVGRQLATPWVFVAVLLVCGLALISASRARSQAQTVPGGLTTELAGIAVCLLGGVCVLGQPEIAVGIGIVTAAVLAYKQPLHGWVEKLGWDDIFAGLRLAIATFIVLPLLPNRPVDPWQALNPYALWWLVILISSLSLVGYVATRWLGPGRGAAVTGLTGGLVSSTAVTISFSRQSRDAVGGSGDALAAGILLAWGVMFVRVVVTLLIVQPSLVGPIALPFAAMAVSAAACAWFFYRRSTQRRVGKGAAEQVPLRNPFRLGEAIRFAAYFAVVLLAVRGVEIYGPRGGLYVVAALAGLTDVDAITISVAQSARSSAAIATAVTALVIAVSSNTAVKLGLTLFLGTAALRRRTTLGAAIIVAAGGLALLLP